MNDDLRLTAPRRGRSRRSTTSNRAALGDYLRAQGRGFEGTLRVEQFAGGQSNPTYLVTAGADRYVLRRKPPGELLPVGARRRPRYTGSCGHSPTAACRCPGSSRCAKTRRSSVPAFFLMEYVQGRVFWDPTLPGVEPAERAALYDELNRVIAALHGVDHAKSASRTTAGRATTCGARSRAGRASTAPPRPSGWRRWSG
jgi:aminoglycoside phosphotransferase (APT) family kinase protein